MTGVLDIADLSVAVAGQPILSGVSLTVEASEIVGVVGESGSGKSTLARAVARLLPPGLVVAGGSITLRGRDLLGPPPAAVHRMRRGGISMVFQNPVSALNPAIPVGEQVAEALRPDVGRRRALDRSVELLERMGIADAGRRVGDYPYQFSGGQRQRIVIAIALATEPAVLLADEPTSSVDVTTQAAILGLFREVVRERGTSLVLISHNYAVISQMCASTLVLYAGRALEYGTTDVLLSRSLHPYTSGLIASLPSLDHAVPRLRAIPGSPPRLGEVGKGCPFEPRCHLATDACTDAPMVLVAVSDQQASACIRATELPSFLTPIDPGGADGPAEGPKPPDGIVVSSDPQVDPGGADGPAEAPKSRDGIVVSTDPQVDRGGADGPAESPNACDGIVVSSDSQVDAGGADGPAEAPDAIVVSTDPAMSPARSGPVGGTEGQLLGAGRVAAQGALPVGSARSGPPL